MAVDEDSQASLYAHLGGEAGLRRLVESFYRHMDTLPEAKGIRAMHAADLSEASEKLFCFLSGWSGGPALFMQRFGHPMLRRRHFPFAIGKSERDQWMICMVHAIEELGYSDLVRTELIDALLRLADHMRNKPQEPADSSNS